ncbi:MAG TPA: hypothetical protein VG499_08955 [Actinomycetota bacterium]|nr:hypothetical protein [Actinomycetota bacterium]
MNLDDRLRAAGSALREGSVTQVDAATGLRAIILCADPGADDQAGPLDEPAGHPVPSLLPQLRRRRAGPSAWPWPSTCCWS